MSISEQTNEYDVIRDEVDLLRKLAASYNAEWKEEAAMVFSHAADTIESLSAKLQVANMERSAADCGGGWIPCSSGKMPHMGCAVIIQLKYSEDGITGDDDMTYDISFLRTDKNEWVSCCGTYPFEDVIAWRKIKPYYEP